MLTRLYSCVIAVALMLHAFVSVEAAGVSANGSAVVFAPIQVSEQDPMNFGVFASPVSPSTILLGFGSSRTATGGLELVDGGPCCGPFWPSNGIFALVGEPFAAFTVTLPANFTVSDGANSMTVDTFIWEGGCGEFEFCGNGFATIDVGATLHIGASQPANAYSGTYQFSVLYD